MRFALLALPLLALAACSSAGSAGGTLAVYESADEVPGGFEIVAEVTPTGAAARSSYGNRDTGLQEARRSASTLGADAVLMISPDDVENNAAVRDFLRGASGGVNTSTIATVRRRYFAIRLAAPTPAEE